MHFTRDPIIETIISPKDGFKLSIRSSHSESNEEYLVNALEVVSFGSALFFRSLEKPKAFLLPISDYEVVEVKEARMVLKNVSLEKPIKIGDGKESKAQDEDASNKKDKSESKKGSKKRASRKKRSKSENNNAEKQVETKEPKKEANVEEAASTQDKEAHVEVNDAASDEANLSQQPPAAPFVFPTPPKVIGRKPPVSLDDENTVDQPPVEQVAESDAQQPKAEATDPHHPQEELVDVEIQENTESVEQVDVDKSAESENKEVL